MASIAKLFRRTTEMPPEELGAALHERTLDTLSAQIDRCARDPSLLGGIERATFFAELITLLNYAAARTVTLRLGEGPARDRALAAFRARHEEFRRSFDSKTLTPAETRERDLVYDSFAYDWGNERHPLGVPFAKWCGSKSPIAATTANVAYQTHVRAITAMLEKTHVVA